MLGAIEFPMQTYRSVLCATLDYLPVHVFPLFCTASGQVEQNNAAITLPGKSTQVRSGQEGE